VEVTLVEAQVPTRMGDGSLVELTRSQIRAELEDGTEAAVKRGKVEPLAQDEHRPHGAGRWHDDRGRWRGVDHRPDD